MSHADEVAGGSRFEFGANWARFLDSLDETRIASAEVSLREAFEVETLQGRTFLDIGSGSGLFSLAARRLGAHVHSFDYDPQSVACTKELRSRYFRDDPLWRIEEASALDATYLESIGRFDIVYSYGVLHHSGSMWLAIERAISRVKDGGALFLAIYNDQGWKSHFWWFVKYGYNKLPRFLKPVYAYGLGGLTYLANIIKYTVLLRPAEAIAPLINYRKYRGMSVARDMVDWIGGFPFEFARFDVLKHYLEARGFVVSRARTATSLGCHELTALRRTDGRS